MCYTEWKYIKKVVLHEHEDESKNFSANCCCGGWWEVVQKNKKKARAHTWHSSFNDLEKKSSHSHIHHTTPLHALTSFALTHSFFFDSLIITLACWCWVLNGLNIWWFVWAFRFAYVCARLFERDWIFTPYCCVTTPSKLCVCVWEENYETWAIWHTHDFGIIFDAINLTFPQRWRWDKQKEEGVFLMGHPTPTNFRTIFSRCCVKVDNSTSSTRACSTSLSLSYVSGTNHFQQDDENYLLFLLVIETWWGFQQQSHTHTHEAKKREG